ncbi:MAG: glycosyltransferase family 4 protein [Acidobacteriota bacterium]
MSQRILVCNSQMPFLWGGAEILAESLVEELAKRDFEVELVRLPFSMASRRALLESALAWRLLDVTAVEEKTIDRVICTRFPSYLVRHPRKVVWLVHQVRQIYDLRGTHYSNFDDSPRDERVVEMVHTMDRRSLSEARRRFAISQNVAGRLERHLGLTAESLYPPSKLAPRLSPGPESNKSGDYVFSAGRLVQPKRFELLIRAMPHAPGVRCVIAGRGPEREQLEALAEQLGVADRLELPGWVSDDELVSYYRDCLAVFYAPFDEDYGYVTIEAFKAGKPVLTTSDAGGVLEFVVDGENGYVCEAGADAALGRRMAALAADRELASRLGAAGEGAVADIDWDHVIARLTE